MSSNNRNNADNHNSNTMKGAPRANLNVLIRVNINML